MSNSLSHNPQLPSPASDQHSSPAAAPLGTASSGNASNTRARPITACLTCRNRKIKCDRGFPCNNCIKSDRDCRYDASQTLAASAAAKPTGVTKHSSVPEHHHSAAKTESDLQRRISRLEEMLSAGVEKIQYQADAGVEILPRATSQLQITEGRTRYLGPLAWISAVEDEIGDLKQQVQKKLVEPQSAYQSQWLFPPASSDMASKLLSYIPDKELSDVLYNTYLERILPQSPIVHKPTLSASYLEFWSGTMPPAKRTSFIAMLFSIYHAAVYSMDPDMVLRICGQDRDSQLLLYREATQQALVEAKFLETGELVTLQAMTTLAWTHVTRARHGGAWVLISVSFRVARMMGLHRDPENFPEIEPVEGEIRRRLWFEVFHMETYSMIQESPYISEDSFDTKTPGNYNDDDLLVGRPLPESRLEYTDMSHFLFRVAMNKHYVRALELTSGIKRVKKEDFQRLIRDIQDWGMQWETFWLPTYRDDLPMQRMAKKTARLLLNKAILVLYYPFSKPRDRKLLPSHIRESALSAACTTLEMHSDLITDPQLSNFVYYFSGYNQFLSLAILLGELIDNPSNSRRVRIWACVDRMFVNAVANKNAWAFPPGTQDWDACRALYENACLSRTDGGGPYDAGGDPGVRRERRPGQHQNSVSGTSVGSAAGSATGSTSTGGSKVMEEIEQTGVGNGEIDWESWDKMIVDGLFDEFLIKSPQDERGKKLDGGQFL